MAERARGQYLAEALEREREARRKNLNERVLRASGFPLQKSLESIDCEKAAGKCGCSAQRSLGRRLSRSNRECADFGNPGFFEVPGICNIASTAKMQSLHLRQRRPEMGGYPSTTLPQNVALRPSMSEFCMMLGDSFIDSLKYGRSDCESTTFSWTGENLFGVIWLSGWECGEIVDYLT